MLESRKTRILFLTVGNGKPEDINETILRPFRKTMIVEDFTHYVFLPSKTTVGNAHKVIENCENNEQFKGKEFFVEALENEDDEFNTDKCFKHFNNVIQKYMTQYNCSADDIVLDPTRGTKGMGGALYTAGFRYGIVNYHYIEKYEGEEKVLSIPAAIGLFLSKTDQARNFLKSYNFNAVETLFKGGHFSDYQKAGEYVYHCARFYGAWHRLNYKEAAKEMDEPVLKNPSAELRKMLTTLGLKKIILTDDDRNWIKSLSQEWKNDAENWKKQKLDSTEEYEKNLQSAYNKTCQKKVPQVFRIAVDLLANGRRQLKIGNYEDAKVRIYRLIELVGQIYLFSKGYDTAYINKEDKNIKKLNDYYTNKNKKDKNKKNPLQLINNCFYQLPRERAASFIKHVFDKDLGQTLLNAVNPKEKGFIMDDAGRNISVLIHGFTVQSSAIDDSAFDELKKLLKRVVPAECNFETCLKAAHRINEFEHL